MCQNFSGALELEPRTMINLNFVLPDCQFSSETVSRSVFPRESRLGCGQGFQYSGIPKQGFGCSLLD